MAVKVIVSGHGEIKRQPELGIVTIQVRSTGSEQARVSSDVRNTVKMVQDQLAPLASSSSSSEDDTSTAAAPAVKEWSSGLLSTYSYFEHPGANAQYHSVLPRSARARVYEASVKVTATFTDFARLADFSTAMSLVPHTHVQDVRWVLSPETKPRITAEAISLAYADAKAKGDAYAEALGKSGVTPVEISQEHDTPYGVMPMMAAAADASGGQDGERLACVPEDVSFSVNCQVTFQIE
jgi:uncharacterized protein YggE